MEGVPIIGSDGRIRDLTADDLTAYIESQREIETLGKIIETKSPKRWGALRELYALMMDDIREAHPRTCDPYFINWTAVFTPIEMDAWQTIRGRGLPLYPQVPAGRFFVDFGDPVSRIAIECDGAAWHADKDRDARRDAELDELGWTVYRVTGKECWKPGLDWCEVSTDLRDEVIPEERAHEIVSEWLRQSSDGVITAIGAAHYGIRSDACRRYQSLAFQTLDAHRTAGDGDYPDSL